MGTIVYNPNMTANKVYVDSAIETMVQNGLVKNSAIYESGRGLGSGFNLGEIIADGIEEGVRRTLKYLGSACVEGLKIVWEFTVDVSFYVCIFTATANLLMAYCGDKKSKKRVAVIIVVYILLQMVNAILKEQGFLN